ncbi:hypothetical protein [Nonomuraea sp. NPDC048826]|uniref:hypothetical protein n=1 Tax=Nonomuraea sp. NPDC048826 TaxID=3364347 RepID=UPI00371219F8
MTSHSEPREGKLTVNISPETIKQLQELQDTIDRQSATKEFKKLTQLLELYHPTSVPAGYVLLHDNVPAGRMAWMAGKAILPGAPPPEPRPEPPPEPRPAAKRVLRFASVAAVEPESDEEWRADLRTLVDEGASRWTIAFFLLGVLYAGLHSRVAWLARRAHQPGISLLRWILRSEARTWLPLGYLMWWAAIETTEDTGGHAAILLILASVSALAISVNWLRNRFDAHPRKRQKAADK